MAQARSALCRVKTSGDSGEAAFEFGGQGPAEADAHVSPVLLEPVAGADAGGVVCREDVIAGDFAAMRTMAGRVFAIYLKGIGART